MGRGGGADRRREERQHVGTSANHLELILNSAAAIGIGPAPQDMGKQYELMRLVIAT